MADRPVFESVSEQLERETELERMEARGTLRIALKAAGLAAKNLTATEAIAVLQHVLPEELTRRGVEASESICERIRADLARSGLDCDGETPQSVFERLGG